MPVKTLDITREKIDIHKPYQIILYNDPVNSFDHVINCLIEICKHTPQQAEQCAYIAHTTGKCSVKKGGEIEMIQMASKLGNEGLTTEVQQVP